MLFTPISKRQWECTDIANTVVDIKQINKEEVRFTAFEQDTGVIIKQINFSSVVDAINYTQFLLKQSEQK